MTTPSMISTTPESAVARRENAGRFDVLLT